MFPEECADQQFLCFFCIQHRLHSRFSWSCHLPDMATGSLGQLGVNILDKVQETRDKVGLRWKEQCSEMDMTWLAKDIDLRGATYRRFLASLIRGKPSASSREQGSRGLSVGPFSSPFHPDLTISTLMVALAVMRRTTNKVSLSDVPISSDWSVKWPRGIYQVHSTRKIAFIVLYFSGYCVSVGS